MAMQLDRMRCPSPSENGASRASAGRPRTKHRAAGRSSVRRTITRCNRQSRGALVLTVAALVVACHDSSLPLTPNRPTVAASFVTGNAAAHLDARGHFQLPMPAPAWPDEEIDAARAEAIAKIDVRVFDRSIRGWLEKEHGGPIDLDALSVCGPTYYADTPFDVMPAAAGTVYRVGLGPAWLVSFCDADGVQVLSEAVPALATNIEIKGNLLIWRGGNLGGSIISSGVPPGMAIPLPPEEAVRFAASLTGRRVSEVPQLLRLSWSPFGAPQMTAWRLTLDAPAHVRGANAGTASDETTVYVSDTYNADRVERLYRARIDTTGLPPDEVRATAVTGPTGQITKVPLRRRVGIPRALEVITPIAQEK